MSAASLALQWVLGGAFTVLGVLTGVDWLKHRDRLRSFLALSVCLLSLVAVLAAVSTLRFPGSWILSDIDLAAFLASGWAFLHFRDGLLPLKRLTRQVADILVLLTVVLSLVAYTPAPTPGTSGTALQQAVAILLIVVWAACVVEPLVRFSRLSFRLPPVQRARLRALVAAYGGIVLVLVLAVVAVFVPSLENSIGWATTPLSFLVVPLFLLAFAPPRWIRRVWRAPEERQFHEALNDLLAFSADRRTLATRAVHWAARLLGADGAMIATDDSAVLVTTGVDDGERWAQADAGSGDGAARRAPNNVIEVPLTAEFTKGVIAVGAGPLTPLFGDEELQRLREYSESIAIALDRVQLFERLRRSAELINLAYDPILTWRVRTNKIIFFNVAAQKTFGWTAEEAVGREPAALLKTELPRPRAEILDVLRREGTWEGEIRQTTKDGRVLDIGARWALQRDDNGEPDVVLEINHDMTDEKRVANELSKARDQAIQASAAKSEYLSRMSHELRTPLTAILGYGDLLELREPRDDQMEAVDAIQQASSHLLSMVNDVLDIARIEAGRENVEPESVSLRGVVEECTRLVAPLAEQHHSTITVDIDTAADVTVEADRQRLIQSLLNLLSNAAKYAGEDAAIVLRASASESRVRLEVTDSGPGIAEEAQERLFQPFERLGAERTSTPGTGLGLALTKRLVEAMGGQLGVESAPGEGSTFWIELNRAAFDAATPAERGAAAAPATVESGPHDVLYVEDNLATVRLMEDIFRLRPGIRMITAMQGRLALELAQEHQPDLIILDLHLPDVAGDEVLQQLRADPRTSRIPVVMFSADATPRQVKRLLELGAQRYMLKPAKVTEFLTMLDEVLSSRAVAAG